MREIQIIRRETKSHLPPPVVSNTKKILASIYTGQGPLKGLEGDEEKRILGDYLGIDPEDRDFSKICREFWADLRVPIPSEGRVLNITVIDGEPVNKYDYIIYKWATKHKLVASSKEEMLDTPHKQFYIYDPEKEVIKENKRVQFKKDAYKEFIKISDNEDKIDHLIRLLSDLDPSQMNIAQKQNYLDGLIEDDPERFVVTAKDKDLEIKAEIAEMVSLNILRKIGNQIWFIEEKFGDTLEDAVLYYKDKKNSEKVTLVKAKLQEARRMR